jgi:HEAT repeat protein
MKVTQAAGALVVALNDESWGVRESAAVALGTLRSQEAGPALLTALVDADELVRRAAVIALGQIGERRAVDSLLAILKGVPAGRMGSEGCEVAEALGRIGDRRAFEPLILRLSAEQDGKSDFGASCCAQALQALTGQNFGTDAARWREWLKGKTPASSS